MIRFFLLLFCAAIQVHASIFDWFSTTSEKAKRAQMVMEGFDEIAKRAMEDYEVPGLAIGIVVDGHLVYAKGFGYRDVEKKLPVTADTMFPIASCTKAFTAFIAGSLVDEGILSWDQMVIDVLPEFRLFDQYATQNLTMRDLLTHRSGMPRHDFMWYNSTMSRAEVIRRIRYLEPSCDLRERYQYGNLMYLTAGYAMEQLAGKSWEAMVSEKILSPLKMKRTNFSVEEMQKDKDFAYPYREKNGQIKRMPFRDVSLVGPAASINSSVNDISHWIQMQLAGGIYEGTPMISPATLQEMHTPQVIIPGAPESKESLIYAYGIGWGISSYRGQYFLSHDGGIDGFTSVVGILPHKGIGVVVLANRNLTSLPRFLSLQAIDRVLELPQIDWLKEGLDGIKKSKESAQENKKKEDFQRKKGTTPSHPLEQYAGAYEHPGYGIVKIECVEGKLRSTFNGIASALEHWHYDVFEVGEESQDTLISREGTKIAFRNDVRGEIEDLVIPFEPNAGDIVFRKKVEAAHSTLSYLRQFIGLYEIYGYTVEIVIRNHALCAVIPGQPLYELVPTGADNEFNVKSMTGYTVRFILKEGKVDEVLLVQPYGAFTAKPKR
jgi:CubicO group peptidase (beta-lactamase class C family)